MIAIPGDATYAYSYAYGTNGLLSTLTYPVSTSSYQLGLQYAYTNGILRSITDTQSGTVYWTANTTNPRGQVTQETLGNGVVTNRAFDAVTGWVGSIQSGVSSGAALQNNAFLYDDLGDVTQRQDNNQGLTENFYYDTDYRLDHSTLNGTLNLQMAYDTTGMGNIASRSDVAGGTAWTYDSVRKHAVTQAGTGGHSYTYDANGNAITRSGYTATWTSYNYPSGIGSSGESVTFNYGPDRQRWKTIYTGSIGTETTYHVGKVLEKVALGGVLGYRHYIFAGNELVAIYSRMSSGTNTVRYVLEDHQSSFASILSSTGTADVSESFTAYGNRRSGETWAGAPTTTDENAINGVSRWGYTGQTALGVSMGLNHMNGRVQDAITGRFLSPDPNIPDPGNTQSFNRYSYVNNNPLTLVDPSGFDEDPPVLTQPIDGGPTGDGTTDCADPAACLQEVVVRCTVRCGPEVPTPPPPTVLPPGSIISTGEVPTLPPVASRAPTAPITPAAPTVTAPTPPKTPLAQSQNSLPEITVTAQKCTNTSSNGSLGDQVSDAIVGFGDAFLIPILVRNAFDIQGSVNYNSSAYNGGMIGGTIWGLVPFALEGAASYSGAQAARGTPSVLNANPYFRIGPGRWGGNMVPGRISSPYLPGDGHFSLSIRLPPIPPLGALASSGGC